MMIKLCHIGKPVLKIKHTKIILVWYINDIYCHSKCVFQRLLISLHDVRKHSITCIHRIMAHQVLNDLKAHTQVKKFQSFKLCYIGLYHRKSILHFSSLHLKEICTR